MTRSGLSLFLIFLSAFPLGARRPPAGCGTHPGRSAEVMSLHRATWRSGLKPKPLAAVAAAPTLAPAADIGDIAIVGDGEGVVSRLNPFNLNGKTLTFQPVGAKYHYQLIDSARDDTIANPGEPVTGLDDDDSREVPLPFSFPFFGKSYRSLYVNSDGNLTFSEADGVTGERSLGRLLAGPPRIAGLFTDLDPSRSRRGVRLISEPGRFVVAWPEVPLYQEVGLGPLQTFQIALFPDGRIEISFAAVAVDEAVVGIAPGNLRGESSVVTFTEPSSREFDAAVAERFTKSPGLDVVTAAQRFYQTHEDAYDYLVFFNSVGIPASRDAVAYELTVRTSVQGIGDESVDIGAQFGSPRRLRAVMNMGPLSQYPRDPYAVVPSRAVAGDTPMSVLAHEAGHLFLAYASVADPARPGARPMLGRQMAHWAFTFNSEASVLEGNRIEDRGPAVTPRFLTIGTVEAYAPLDQYLMGLRPPWEVPPTFLVENATVSATSGPARGRAFDGRRRDITVDELIQTVGRRVPDHTVAQKEFRFAFILIVPEGQQPSAEEVAQLERYRREFESFFAQASSYRASASTTLRRALRVSVFPSAGLLLGARAKVSVSTASPLKSALPVVLRTQTGVAAAPSAVVIPAGSSEASFEIVGRQNGVETLVIEPADPAYETVTARIQVSEAKSLRLEVASGDRQRPASGFLPSPVVFRLTDANNLPYPDVPLRAVVTGGGRVESATVRTDENGLAAFRWAPGSEPLNLLTVSIDGVAGSPSAAATVAGPPVVVASAVVNAASYESGITPGALATIFGVNLADGFTATAQRVPLPTELAGVQVLLDGVSVPIHYVSDRQINFLVPPDQPPGTVNLAVQNAAGRSQTTRVPVVAVQPGIFFDPDSGQGKVRENAGFLEIYCTGLGPFVTASDVTVTFGNQTVPASFAGYSSAALGLQQVNVPLPGNLPPQTTLRLTVSGRGSNQVTLSLRP